MKKRTEITLETDRVLVIRLVEKPVRAWCPGCSDEVVMTTPEKAAALAFTSLPTIYRWIDAGHVHCTETERALHVCLNSLFAASSTEDRNVVVKGDSGGVPPFS